MDVQILLMSLTIWKWAEPENTVTGVFFTACTVDVYNYLIVLFTWNIVQVKLTVAVDWYTRHTILIRAVKLVD